MIYIIGDMLVEANPNVKTVLINPVNDTGRMNSRLHIDICHTFPFVKTLYQQFCTKLYSRSHQPGDIQIFSGIELKNLILVNAPICEMYPGKLVADTTLEHAFEAIARNFAGYTLRVPYKLAHKRIMTDKAWENVMSWLRWLENDHKCSVEIWDHTPDYMPQRVSEFAKSEV